jgi:hypothetical protein
MAVKSPLTLLPIRRGMRESEAHEMTNWGDRVTVAAVEHSDTNARESGGEAPGLHGMRLAEMEEGWGYRLTRAGAKPFKFHL